jgi:hypothetical protein
LNFIDAPPCRLRDTPPAFLCKFPRDGHAGWTGEGEGEGVWRRIRAGTGAGRVSSSAFFSPSINVRRIDVRSRAARRLRHDCGQPAAFSRLERKPPAEAREERADARTVLSILAKGRESEREKERERERERERKSYRASAAACDVVSDGGRQGRRAVMQPPPSPPSPPPPLPSPSLPSPPRLDGYCIGWSISGSRALVFRTFTRGRAWQSALPEAHAPPIH